MNKFGFKIIVIILIATSSYCEAIENAPSVQTLNQKKPFQPADIIKHEVIVVTESSPQPQYLTEQDLVGSFKLYKEKSDGDFKVQMSELETRIVNSINARMESKISESRNYLGQMTDMLALTLGVAALIVGSGLIFTVRESNLIKAGYENKLKELEEFENQLRNRFKEIANGQSKEFQVRLGYMIRLERLKEALHSPAPDETQVFADLSELGEMDNPVQLISVIKMIQKSRLSTDIKEKANEIELRIKDFKDTNKQKAPAPKNMLEWFSARVGRYTR